DVRRAFVRAPRGPPDATHALLRAWLRERGRPPPDRGGQCRRACLGRPSAGRQRAHLPSTRAPSGPSTIAEATAPECRPPNGDRTSRESRIWRDSARRPREALRQAKLPGWCWWAAVPRLLPHEFRYFVEVAG